MDQLNNGCNLFVIIPTFEPTFDFVKLVEKFISLEITNIIIVDDGSGGAYKEIFEQAKSLGCVILRHAVNLGKGRALKTAFNYILNEFPDAIGVVTADSDGQHDPSDIKKCMHEFIRHPERLILGCRDFRDDKIPWKSQFGNEFTKKIIWFFCGIKVSDTQTGLRVIPKRFMQKLMNTPGERFEFETNMLLESKGEVDIYEVKISTLYDSKDKHKTHFDPLKDSIMIYKVIFSYSLTSFAATIVDFIVFAVVNGAGTGVWLSTAISRICSAGINFVMNRNIVFKASGKVFKQLTLYLLLVIFSGSISAFIISYVSKIISLEIIVIKAVVETALFFFNYYIQRSIIFRKNQEIT